MSISREKEILSFLMMNRLKIEGRRKVVVLLTQGKKAEEILEQIIAEKLSQNLFAAYYEDKIFDPAREWGLCVEQGIGFLVFTDEHYPALLKEIPDPPLLLYQRGAMTASDQNAVAIVGTRHPSFYGRTQAKRFSQELAAKGLTIVSGLARGIDQVAHEAALGVSYGRTIAVMGCGLDVIYPKENAELYERIISRGSILSEYPLGTPPLPENFPRRNRILSGLSYGTFVVEAHSRSGSLITAHQALEQGREVFALPGPVDQLTSHGTNQLLKEGACLVEKPQDILLTLAERLKMDNRFEDTAVIAASPILSNPVATLKSLWKNFSTSLTSEVSNVIGKRASEVPNENKGIRLPPQEKMLLKAAMAPPPNQKPPGFLDPPDGSDLEDRTSLLLNEETKVIEELLKDEGVLSQDEILEFTGLEPAKLPVLLLQLELAKKIKHNPDGKYALQTMVQGP